MCNFNVVIDDAVMEVVRPTITKGMEESAWVQMQVQTLFAKMAENAKQNKKSDLRLSQRQMPNRIKRVTLDFLKD